MMKNTFYFLFSFLRYLNFCTDFLCHAGKRLDKKAKVNFEIYDATYWIKNHFRICIKRSGGH